MPGILYTCEYSVRSKENREKVLEAFRTAREYEFQIRILYSIWPNTISPDVSLSHPSYAVIATKCENLFFFAILLFRPALAVTQYEAACVDL